MPNKVAELIRIRDQNKDLQETKQLMKKDIENNVKNFENLNLKRKVDIPQYSELCKRTIKMSNLLLVLVYF